MKAIFQTAVFLLVMCVVLTGTLVFMLYVTKAGTPSVQSQNLPFNWEQRVQSAVDLEELKQQCRVFAKFRDMDDLTRRVQEKWMSNVFTYGIAFAIEQAKSHQPFLAVVAADVFAGDREVVPDCLAPFEAEAVNPEIVPPLGFVPGGH